MELTNHLPTKKLWVSTRDYILIVLATLLYSVSFMGFILPHKVVIGGVTGLGTLVFFMTGLPVWVTQYGINLLLLGFAWKMVGKQFVFKTIFGATCLSAFFAITQPLITGYFPNGFVQGEPFMSVVIGGILSGIALGIIFIHNGSTGGTDIVAAIVARHSSLSIGRTMMYVDFCIISSSYFLFHNLNTVIYGFVILFLTAFTLDWMINANRQAVQFTIISNKWMLIADAINKQARRGCTVLNGMGWYSKHDLKMLIVVSRIQESITIYRIIQAIDPNAFITRANVNSVYGVGFDAMKIKAKKTDTLAPHEKPVSSTHRGRE